MENNTGMEIGTGYGGYDIFPVDGKGSEELITIIN